MRTYLILAPLLAYLSFSDARAQEEALPGVRLFKATVGEIRLAEGVEINDITSLEEFRELNKLGKVIINEKLVFDAVEGKKVSIAFEKTVNRVTSIITRLGKTHTAYDQVPVGTKVSIEIRTQDGKSHPVALQYRASRIGPVPDDPSVPQELSETNLTTDTVVSENVPKFILSRSSDEPTFIMILVEPSK